MKRNLLKRAADILQSRLEQTAGEVVVYERPGVGCVAVNAIVGRTEYELESGGGDIDRSIRNDYTIAKSSLVLNECEITPERNDIIYQTLADGTVVENRVLGEGGLSHYQDSDGYGIAYRIHTKRDE